MLGRLVVLRRITAPHLAPNVTSTSAPTAFDDYLRMLRGEGVFSAVDNASPASPSAAAEAVADVRYRSCIATLFILTLSPPSAERR